MSSAARPLAAPPPSDPSDRLESWKEIASYLQRDVRTVRRWERAERLPVHRHAHGQGCSVYAFRTEIDNWRCGRSPAAAGARAVARRYRGWLMAAALGGASAGLATSALPWFPSVGESAPPAPRAADAAIDTVRPWDATFTGPDGAAAGERDRQRSYERGQYYLNRRMGARRALPYLRQAIAADSRFAPAYAALADALARIAMFAPETRAENFAAAEKAARRALALDAALPAGHSALGQIYLYRDWDWERARGALETAVRLAPADANARSSYATYLRAVGRSDAAIAQRRLARNAEPLRVELTSLLGREYLFARRYREAAEEFRSALELEPGYIGALTGLADALMRLDDPEAAAVQTRLLVARGDLVEAARFAERQRRFGVAPAIGWLETVLLRGYQRAPAMSPWNAAFSHARLGDPETAFAYLEEAFRQRDPGLLQLRLDPDVDSLRSDPRFDGLLRRMNAPPPPTVVFAGTD